MILHRLTDRLTVSDAPTETDLPELTALGFQTIVDLRADGDPRPRGIAPWDEARLAAEIGLAYHQVQHPLASPPLPRGQDRECHQLRQNVEDPKGDDHTIAVLE